MIKRMIVMVMILVLWWTLPVEGKSCNVHCPSCDECIECPDCICECPSVEYDCPDCICTEPTVRCPACPDCICEDNEFECPDCNCGQLPCECPELKCPEFPDDRNAAFSAGYWLGFAAGYYANGVR